MTAIPALRRRGVALSALAVVLVACVLLSLTSGAIHLSPRVVAGIGWRMLTGAFDGSAMATEEQVLVTLRLPRVALAVLVGAGLGASGATMQGVFRSPLVDPGLLGVSSGAGLAAVMAIVLGKHATPHLPDWMARNSIALSAFVGALLAAEIVARVARIEGRTVVPMLLLSGIAMNALTAALTGLVVSMANDAELRTLTFWSLGSLGGVTPRMLVAVLPCLVPPLLVLPRLARSLDALLLGEAEAAHLGVAIERTKRVSLVLAALVVGACVSVAGGVGFVGLVIPHLVRLGLGPSHKIVLPGSILLGAALLPCADALARTLVAPSELPLGVVTASLGAPFFLVLLVRERGRLT